ncbi:MAG TPA: ribosome silencing factor [Dehalococcoidia bacterium]|jgi:ribosome-associated protein|nr:ribosome silencing factor [Dehalococcoidia bacterium]
MVYSGQTYRASERWLLLQPGELARRIVDLLSDRQAEDVVLLDISRVASFADYFVIASAINPRHMGALIEALDRDLKANETVSPLRHEGEIDSGWVLVDFGSVIVHLFAPEQRAYYNLEQLWARAREVVRIQ